MSTTAAKSRSDIAREECTGNPIFLFQHASVCVLREPSGYSTDGDSWWKDDKDDGEPDISDQIDDEWLLANDCAMKIWHTERVFFTREEATEWAQARSYRWAYWQVYCVPAEGQLAEILKRTEATS